MCFVEVTAAISNSSFGKKPKKQSQKRFACVDHNFVGDHNLDFMMLFFLKSLRIN